MSVADTEGNVNIRKCKMTVFPDDKKFKNNAENHGEKKK